MDKLTCIIIDDERIAREAFRDLIERYQNDRLEVVGLASSIKEGVFLINSLAPELVFLDIEMPVESGFKLFDYFKTYSFEVIFTTAFRQYAIDAIKYAALDYLLKPVNYIDLRDAIERYVKKRSTNSSQQRIETLISNLNSHADINQKVAFPSMDGYQMQNLNEILYCEGDSNYTRVVLLNGSIIMVPRTLKEIEELLSCRYFFRNHKSYLVNLNFVKSYSRSDCCIYLENNQMLPVSTRRNDEFLSVLTGWRKLANQL